MAAFFNDTFTEASADTVLSSHTPDTGTGWTKVFQDGSNPTISAEATPDTAGSSSANNSAVAYTADATYPSAHYEVQWTHVTSAGFSTRPYYIFVRYQDNDNMYAVRCTNVASGFQLYKKVGGTWSTVGSAVTVATGSVCKIRILGTTLTLYDDTVSVASGTVSDISAAGKAGIASGGGGFGTDSGDDANSTTEIDNFSVTAFESPTVALNSPADASSDSDTTPALVFTGTDAESDEIEYEVQVDTADTFNSVVNSYYFDGSDAAATDPNSVWTNDANAFDGDTGTDATTTNITGSTSANYLMAEGTNAPASGGAITQVRARVYAGNDTSSTYGSYVILSVPSGGWTWAKVQALETKIYITQPIGNQVSAAIYTNALGELLGTAVNSFTPETNSHIAKLEIEVTSCLLDKFSVNGDATFSGTGDPHPWPSGNQITYTVQAGDALSAGTYYWRVRGIDPTGNNEYGAWSSTRSFTVTSGGTDVTVNADVVTATSSLPAPTVSTVRNISVSSDVVTTTASLPTPTVSYVQNISTSADVVTGTASVIDPAVSTTGNVTILTDVVSLTASLPDPTVSYVRNISIASDVVTATASLPTPTVSTVQNINVSADVVTVTSSLPAPTVTTDNSISVTIGDTWTTQYEATSLPQDSTPAWTRNVTGTPTEEIVSGELHLVATSGNHLYYERTADTFDSTGWTLEVKTRILNGTSYSALSIPVQDDANYTVLGLKTDGVQLTINSGSDTYALDATQNHVYRVVVEGKTATLYIDGILRLQVTDNDDFGDVPFIDFGPDGAPVSGSYESYTDYLYYNETEAFAPVGVVLSSSLPTPTITTVKNISVSADVVTVTGSLPSPTVTYIQNISTNADIVTGTLSLPAPTISYVQNTTISADLVTVTSSLSSPTVSTVRNELVNADVVTMTASLPAPTITTEGIISVTVDADVVTATSSLPAPIVTYVQNISTNADVVATTATLPDPTVSYVQNISVSADVVTTTASLPAPTIATVRNISVSSDVVTATASLPSPTVSTIRNELVSSDVVTMTSSLPAPTVITEQPVNVTVSLSTLYLGDRPGSTLIFVDGNMALKVGGIWHMGI